MQQYRYYRVAVIHDQGCDSKDKVTGIYKRKYITKNTIAEIQLDTTGYNRIQKHQRISRGTILDNSEWSTTIIANSGTIAVEIKQ